MHRHPRRCALALALVALTACQPALAPPAAKRTPRPAAATGVDDKALLAPRPAGPTRPVDDGAPIARLAGKVKLISDHGAAIVSNNTGSILANNGGSIVANNGGGLVSNNGGGLVTKTKYALRQAGPAESPLAEAFVEVLDGEGRQLVDADGEPVGAFTDATGAYRLAAPLPAENLVLRVRLFPQGGAKAAGGELLAILPKGDARRDLDLDTAASLGAAYVLEEYVQRRPGVFDKLPGAETELLRREALAALPALPAEPPTYRVADQVAATTALRSKAKGLDDALERIRAILVAGTSIRGGRPATEVALAGPAGLAADAKGNLYVSEVAGGRVRVLRPDGTMALFAGGVSTTAGKDGDDALAIGFETPHGLTMGPDGALYVADRLRNHVRRLETGADGVTRVKVVVGDGRGLVGAVDVPATATSVLGPASLAFGPDGRLYVGELGKRSGIAGRLLALDPDGTLRAVPLPAGWGLGQVSSIVFQPDGSMVVVNEDVETVFRRSPAGEWSVLFQDPLLGDFASAAVAPDGALWISVDSAQRVYRFGADGKPVLAVGKGEQGHSPDGTPALEARLNNPGAMWFDAEGRLHLVEQGAGLIRRIDPRVAGAPLATVAGSTTLVPQGNALGIAISGPAALALDPEGRLVITETTAHTIRRLDGDRLTTLAGGGAGFAGDGGPGAQARFENPGALAYRGAELYVADVANNRVRRIGVDGVITTIAGDGKPYDRKGFTSKPALSNVFSRVWGLAFGPDGRLYWSDNDLHRIMRLGADGTAELVAGAADLKGGDEGDDGPAIAALLHAPTALAFDAKGDLYFADTANMRIRRIAGLDGAAPTIHAVAGSGVAGMLTAEDVATEQPALEAPLLGPVGLVFTPEGDLLVAEAGASKIRTLIGFAGLGELPLPAIGSRIRRITRPGSPDARIRTVAGHGTAVLNDPRSDDSLNAPLGLVIDREGRLVIADSGNNQVKLLPKGGF